MPPLLAPKRTRASCLSQTATQRKTVKTLSHGPLNKKWPEVKSCLSLWMKLKSRRVTTCWPYSTATNRLRRMICLAIHLSSTISLRVIPGTTWSTKMLLTKRRAAMSFPSSRRLRTLEICTTNSCSSLQAAIRWALLASKGWEGKMETGLNSSMRLRNGWTSTSHHICS